MAAAAKATPKGRLRRSDSSSAGIRRRKRGKGFTFEDEDGTLITDEETLGRIRDLTIPPAWKEVWVCPDPLGHIQATGYDEAGRKQYRYHDRWDLRRASRKYAAMRDFAAALPKLRRAVRRDIELEGMPRERALATAVRLLDLGFFRIGGEEYAETNESYGLATIRREHVHREGEEIVFDFPAKSHQRRIQAIGDAAAIAALETMRRRRGGPEDLLAWKEGRRWRDVRSGDINDYIQETIGTEFSAKDFRTWSGTVLAAAALAGEEKPALRDGRQADDQPRRQNRGDGARQHPRRLPPLLHRPADLRPLPRRRDDRRRPPRRDRGEDVGADPAEDRARGPRADRLTQA